MIKIIQTKPFHLGFTIASVLFLFANLLSFLFYRIEVGESAARDISSSKISISTISQFGFPFPIFHGKYYYSLDQFNFAAFIVNILAALLLSFVLGSVFKLVQSRISLR
ncbi:MAG: hypothetical protein H7070_05660 [Saprospiraceae bacterium]|nr:hypothetical protein [Pyrinomonadaceae bacterium]